MTCIKIQSMITPFINNKLTVKETQEFLSHVKDCPICMEELQVYYYLLSAVKQLDEDQSPTIHFAGELSEMMEEAEEKIIHTKYTYYRKIILLIFIMFILVFLLSFSYAKISTDYTNSVTKSDFHLRIEYNSPEKSFIESQLEKYLMEYR